MLVCAVKWHICIDTDNHIYRQRQAYMPLDCTDKYILRCGTTSELHDSFLTSPLFDGEPPNIAMPSSYCANMCLSEKYLVVALSSSLSIAGVLSSIPSLTIVENTQHLLLLVSRHLQLHGSL